MVPLNAVAERNGERSLWIDGQQVSHLGEGFPSGSWVFDKFFPGVGGERVLRNRQRRRSFRRLSLPYRQSAASAFLWLYVYITKGTAGHATRICFDDVVVAEPYIGPLHWNSIPSFGLWLIFQHG